MDGWKPYTLIAAAILLLYGQSVLFDFTYCDDYRIIVEQQERIGDLSQLPEVFSRSFGILYRPVLEITWMLDAAIGGDAPLVYHLTNLLIHIVACCLIFRIFSRFGFSLRAALLFALLFAVHPLAVQAVVWIPGRNDTLVTLFLFWSFLHFDGMVRKSGTTDWLLHLIAFSLALFTKESAALFPFVCGFYLWIRKPEHWTLKKSGLLALAWVGIGACWWFLRNNALENAQYSDQALVDYLRDFSQNLPALPALIGKLILPWKLSGVATVERTSVIAGFILVAALVLLWFRHGKTSGKRAAFGLVWYLLFALPPLFHRLALAPDHFDYLEHRAYLPMLGFLIVLHSLACSHDPGVEKRHTVRILLAVLVVLACRGFFYSLTFKSPMVFWQAAVAADPERANFHAVLGKLHYDRKDWKAAERSFRTAIELSFTRDPYNYKNLAVILREQGRPEEALPLYEKAYELDSGTTDICFGLARAYYEQGRYDQAEPLFLETVRIDPNRPDVYLYLTGIYAARDQLDRAIEACLKIVKIDASHFHAHNILADLYTRQNDIQRAAKMWEAIVRITPDHLPAYESLLRYHLDQNRPDRARFYGLEILKRGGALPLEIRKKLELPE